MILAISEVIWGVLIASVLTWIGIFLQLRHDSRQRERVRKMTLLRDVLLLAIEKFSNVLTYITYFYKLDVSLAGDYNEALAKIDIICNKETVRLADEFNSQVSKTLHELSPERQEIVYLNDKLESIHQRLTKREGLSEVEKEKLIKLGNELFKKMNARIIKLADKCKEQSKLCYEFYIPLMIAMREELDVAPINESDYRSMHKKAESIWDDSFKKYFSSMQQKFDEAMKPPKI